jgi:hypothetical protein
LRQCQGFSHNFGYRINLLETCMNYPLAMSIGLVIANISGSIRQPPAVTAGNGVTDNQSSQAITGSASAKQASGGLPAANQLASSPSHLTPGVTIVVLELLNGKGTVTATIPSAQQLAAYRNGTASPPS